MVVMHEPMMVAQRSLAVKWSSACCTCSHVARPVRRAATIKVQCNRVNCFVVWQLNSTKLASVFEHQSIKPHWHQSIDLMQKWNVMNIEPWGKYRDWVLISVARSSSEFFNDDSIDSILLVVQIVAIIIVIATKWMMLTRPRLLWFTVIILATIQPQLLDRHFISMLWLDSRSRKNFLANKSSPIES